MMDTQKTTNGLQVIGEGTGIGKSTLHMVGYLGKNCNPVETTAHEYCPVCKEKGQVQVLRTYRINFQESIFLCENPQCIYPLGYKPINSIITSADSENHQVPATHKKRKLCDTSDFSPVESHPKKPRTNNVVKADHTVNTDPVVKCYQNGFCIPKLNLHNVLQNDKQKLNNNVESCMQKVDFETGSITDIYQESPPQTSSPRTQLLPNSELTSASEILLKDDKASTNNTDLCLQWRNTHNLCWLDCILSALVQLETLKFALAEDCSDGKCLLQELLTKYNQATVLLNTCDRSKVKDVLPKAESHLNEIRNRIFTQLQPRLRCKFGKKDSPVFALPLLLKLDQQAEKLFLHSFSWKFECLCCGYKYQDRCEKTLTTFTNIIPDWHPLNAFHVGPCNNCSDRSQRRQMILEKIPSILMLHFIEGLPHNNLKSYSFQLGDNCYQITSIVQYQTDKKHFITWSLNPDGTWLECDDLKGPYCKRHTRFEVPPSEIHIVIWEKKISCVSEEQNAQFQTKHIEDLPLNNIQSNSTVLHCGFDIMLDKKHHREESVRTPDKKEQQVAEDDSGIHDIMVNKIPKEHHREDSVRTEDKNEQQVTEGDSGIHDIMVNKIPEEHHREDSVRTPDKKEQQVAENDSGIHDIMVNKIPEEHHREDSVRTPDKKEQQVAEDDSGIHHGLVNLAQDDLVTLILEEIQVDSEGKLLSNGQTMGNSFAGETSTLQQGQLAFSSHSPCEEFAGTGLAVNNKAVLYENSSICLPLEQLNPADITPTEPKTHDPDPPDSLLARRIDERTNLPNTEHGLKSELQVKRKLPPVENILQKSPDLQDANKIVVNSQVANFTSANNSSQPSHKDQKRGFVGSWVKKLLGKNASFMPSSASALKNERSCRTPSVQRISEVRLPVKGASNFGGFQSRGTNKTTETPKSVAPQSRNTLPLSNFKGFSQSTHLPTASRSATEDPTWNKSGSRLGASGKVTQSHSPPCNSGKAEESDRDKTKRLRLKLLKKLNAKKKKLASLDRLAVEQMKHEKAVSEDVSTPPQTASHSDTELLQSFLRELQHQIDVAGNESEFNVTSASGCTSSSNSDEILAELLSPTSTVASLEAPKSEDECMYMEMVHSSVSATESDDTSVPHAAMTGEDHNYYSPVKDANLELHAISKPSMKKLAFESPTGEDILEDLFSISTPSSMAGDIDLPHFDETLFETW